MSLLGPIIISLFAVLAIKVSESYKRYEVLVVDPYAISNGSFSDTQWCKYTYSMQDISDDEFKKSDYDILLYINQKFATNNAIDAYYKDKPNAFARADIIRELEYRLERLKLRPQRVNLVLEFLALSFLLNGHSIVAGLVRI